MLPLLPDLGNQLLGNYHLEVPVLEQHIHFQIQDQKEFFLQGFGVLPRVMQLLQFAHICIINFCTDRYQKSCF